MQNTEQNKSEAARELASALVDGELRDAELAQALESLRDDEEARTRWHAYQLIGDVLRQGQAAAVAPHDAVFVRQVRERVQARRLRPSRAALSRGEAGQAANDGVWRWRLAAGVSSVAVVALLGWQLTWRHPDAAAPLQLARQTMQPSFAVQADRSASEAPLVVIRDPRLDQLIAAHQQLGGASALQMPAGFLRNATFERPGR